MTNLIIGENSQLTKYLRNDNTLVASSRNLDLSKFDKKWDRVYLCFGESRKFLQDEKIYDLINYKYTIKLVDYFIDKASSIIVYGTCELWNRYSGPVSLSLDFSFYNTPYINSKSRLCEHIITNSRYSNVSIIHPFNFNSPMRKQNFLFGKVFHSIINKKNITIGNTYYYRDIVHPKFVTKESKNATQHKMIGSGRLIFVNDFIRDLYNSQGMSFEVFVDEEENVFKECEKRTEYYFESKMNLYSYNSLLKDTINDIEEWRRHEYK